MARVLALVVVLMLFATLYTGVAALPFVLALLIAGGLFYVLAHVVRRMYDRRVE